MRFAKGLLVASLMAGCGGFGSVGSDEAALDSTEASGSEAALFSSAAAMQTSGASGVGLASDIAAHWGAQFQPAGCATSTSAGNVVTLVTNACTGPYGLVAVTGTVEVTVTPALNGYSAHANTVGLKVNRATLNIDSSWTYTNNGAQKSVTVQAGGTAIGARGHQITRSGEYTVTWTSECLSLDGAWTTTFDGISYQTDVNQFSQCKGQCPAAGGSVAWTGASRSVSIEFDGSSTADVTITGGRRGSEGTLSLFCGR